MKTRAYLYALLFCLSVFLPTQSFAAKNDVSSSRETSFPVTQFGDYVYKFHRAEDSEESLSIYRSADGEVWERLDQTIAEGEYYIQDAIVYRDAFYVLIPDNGSKPGQIWKSTDGLHFVNVVDEVDSPYSSSVRELYDFFVIDGKLCVFGKTIGTARRQVHCSTDGESWIAQNATGYMRNKGGRVRGIANILYFNNKVYALVYKYQPNRLILVSSTDGIDWNIVVRTYEYFSYKKWNVNTQMIRFDHSLYLFLPSKNYSGVQLVKLVDNELITIEHEGLENLREVSVSTLSSGQEAVYIYGKRKINGKMQKCLYRSSDMANWSAGECFKANTKQLSLFNEINLFSVGERLFLGEKDVTF